MENIRCRIQQLTPTDADKKKKIILHLLKLIYLMSSLFASRHSLTQMGMISSAFLCHRSLRLLLILASGRLVNGKQNFSINEIQRRGKPRRSRERTFNVLRAKVLSQIKISSRGSRSM